MLLRYVDIVAALWLLLFFYVLSETGMTVWRSLCYTSAVVQKKRIPRPAETGYENT